MEWLLLLAGLEFPAVMALLDCLNRDPSHFDGGEDGRRSWLRWLGLAVLTVPVLAGYAILLGYHETVVKKNRAASG